MATHARQQYFADESSLSKEKREFSIAEEVQQKIDSIEEGAQVNTIETIKVNGVEVQPDENKAIDLAVPGVVDSLDSTSSTDALSARQGKVLYDYIQDVSHIGHFLALWNASTGLPVTDPETSPYIYNTGDFYTISVVAPIGETNYRPDGTQFVIGQASTTVETENISVNDFYFYDGQVWRHMINSGAGSIAIDDSLSTTSTNPVTNRRVTQAINSKQDVLTAGVGINIDSNNEISNTQPGPIISATQPSTANEGDQWYDTTNSALKVYDGTQWNEVGSEGNTKTFYLSSTSDLVNAQAAYDWIKSGKYAIVEYGNPGYSYYGQYLLYEMTSSYVRFKRAYIVSYNNQINNSIVGYEVLTFNKTGDTISSISTSINSLNVLRTDGNNSSYYTPIYDSHPATKKYVDDEIANIDLSTKQDKLIAGANIQIASDGKTISAIDTTYTAGTGISIDANNVISSTQASAEWGNITGTLSDQTDLQDALDAKADEEDVNTKTFYLSSASDVVNAQAIIDYILSGKNAIVSYQGVNYIYATYSSNNYNKFFDFDNSELTTNTAGSTVTKTHKRLIIRANVSTNTVNNISTSDIVVSDVYSVGTGLTKIGTTLSADTTVLATQTDLSTKQDTLVSGTNIKTINGTSILGSGNITTPAVVLSLPAVGDDERELYAALYTGKSVTLKSGGSYYQVWKFIDNTSTTGKFTVCASNGNDNVTDDATLGYMIRGESSNGITEVIQYSKDYFTALNNGVRVFSNDAPLGTYWNVSSALDWQNQGGQVIFKRNNYLSPDHKDIIYYVSYWDMNNNTIYLLSETGTGPEKHVVTYNASGQVTNVTTTSLSGGLQVSPNSTITGIKYVWYGTESDYANLSQYYTDQPGDTEFHTF